MVRIRSSFLLLGILVKHTDREMGQDNVQRGDPEQAVWRGAGIFILVEAIWRD